MVPLILTGLFALLLNSCGVHNYGPGDNDGIYQSETETAVEADNQKSSYYKQYFESKDKTYEDLPEEDLIFTDIEAYSTTESMDEEGYIVIEENYDYDDGYGGWGNNAEDISINIYNYGGYYGHFYNPFWYSYWYYPRWNWNFGFYWGYPHYYGWGYPYYYYSGYHGHYYNPYYWYPYNQGHISYNRGRRNTDYYPGRTVNRGRTNTVKNRNAYSRSETIRRKSSLKRNSTITRPRGQYKNTIRDSRNAPNKTIRNNRTKRSENGVRNDNTLRNNNNRSRNNNNVSIPSSTKRSSNYTPRSNSNTRSSGSIRSSGGRRGSGGRN